MGQGSNGRSSKLDGTTINSHRSMHAPPTKAARDAEVTAEPRSSGQVLTTRVGLQLPPGLPFQEWAEAGRKLARLVDAFAWCLGDWLVYGQERYESRYLEAIEKVGLDYQTLRNYAWVARKFEASRRRERLSFQHHAEVAALPHLEQDHWLDRAEKHGWSKRYLRQQVRSHRDSVGAIGAARSILPRIDIGEDQLQSWRVAADRTGADLVAWIIATLDREAARALGEETAE
jgi:hypothetical protein